jgi:hypothetical protein
MSAYVCILCHSVGGVLSWQIVPSVGGDLTLHICLPPTNGRIQHIILMSGLVERRESHSQHLLGDLNMLFILKSRWIL